MPSQQPQTIEPDRALCGAPADGWMDVTAMLRMHAAQSPDKTAILFLDGGDEQEISFAQLHEEAVYCALDLLAHGVEAGQRAVLAHPPGIEFVIAYFGSLLAGLHPVPVQLSLSPAGLQRIAMATSAADAALLLCNGAMLGRLQAGLGPDCAARAAATDQAMQRDIAELPPRPIAAADIAFIQFSSGSTGKPKGIAVSHGNLVSNIELLRGAFHTAPSDVAVSWLPHYHDMGLIAGVLHSVYSGITAVLLPPAAFLRRPASWPEAISRHRGSLSIAPNFGYEHCARTVTAAEKSGLDLSSWDVAISGAERVRPATLERFAAAFDGCGFDRRAFYPSYGLAEATLMVSGGVRGGGAKSFLADAEALERGQALPAGAGRTQQIVGCGAPRAEIVIVDQESLEPCAGAMLGEICVAGAGVASGYWQDGAPRDFTVRLAHDPHKAFLRTGDIGFLRDGELFVTGRIKDVIIVRGRNIFAEDIEAAVQRTDAALREGCGAAFSVEDDAEERLVVVQEVGDATIGATRLAEIFAAIRETLWTACEIVPARMLLVPPGQVPRTTSGKVQRGLCRAAFAERRLRALASWSSEDGRAPAMEPA
jgi:acyl-CoA synthetase (AMP-forming)/AMP-acid ligase II